MLGLVTRRVGNDHWQGATEPYCESAGSSMLGCLNFAAASAVNGLLLYLL